MLNVKQPEKNCIYRADCIEVLRGLPERSVDLVIADPPYYRMKGDFDFVFQTVSEYHKVGTTAPYPLARTVSVEPPPRTGRTPLDVSGSPFVYHQESII